MIERFPEDEQLFKEVHEILTNLKRELVQHLKPLETITTQTQLLRLFDIWKQTSLWRMIDLAEASCQMFQEGRLVPGCTLTRSVFESIANLYYVHKKMLNFTENHDPEAIRDLLMNFVFGAKDTDTMKTPVNILTLIQHLDKEFKGFSAAYAHLCEYAHPNMKSGFGSFADLKRDSLELKLGMNPKNLPMGVWGLGLLSFILQVGFEINNRLCVLQPKFEIMLEKHTP